MTEFAVSSIMRRDYPGLTPEMPIRKAVALLVEGRLPAAPVTDAGGNLVGILTQKDCFAPVLQAAYHQDWRGTVADYMSAEILTVEASDDVTHAAELFLSQSHRQFPVLEGAKLVGMLYRADVLARLSGLN